MKYRVILCALAALAAAAASADRLVLKSGAYLVGKAGEAKNGKLKFKSDDLGEVEVKLEKIDRLEDAGSHVIKYVDGRKETKKLSVEKGKYVADAKPLDMKTIKEIDPAVEKWHGSIHGAFQADRGNSYGNTGSFLANLNRRWEHDRFKADFGYYYAETGTSSDDRKKSTDRWEFETQHDHFWTQKFYTYENGRFDRDVIAELIYRLRLGVGGGWQWLDKNEFASGLWSFNQEAGLNWIKNHYYNDDPSVSDSYCALRYAHHLKYLPKWAKGLEGFHDCEYLPDIADWENYLVKANVGFTSKLFWKLDLLAKIEWDFNSKPSSGRHKSDIRYIVGLGYKW